MLSELMAVGVNELYDAKDLLNGSDSIRTRPTPGRIIY
jgi:hypothetical protein